MAPATDRIVGARKWARGRLEEISSAIAEETPIALVFNGVSHVVMMATPADLEDFALGFSLSEGIVQSANEILEIETAVVPAGIEVRLRVTARRFQALKDRRRNLAGRTGCGLCGVDSLEQAVRPVQPVQASGPIAFEAVERALDALGDAQTINRRTRSLHAAGFARPDGTLAAVCEDVGRHNALDKLIGRLAREHIDPADGFALVTSRCSFELVQKAVTVGIHTLAAISAPTALALDMAEQAGLSLIALARPDSFILFTHGGHLVATAPAEMQKVES